MCGIVGYVGEKDAAPLLIESLKRLEYRGYDSSGLAVLDGGRLEVRRRAGKIVNLERALMEDPVQAHVGIGHTRWATHGPPSDANAHPHTDCARSLAVVHNGIIENYLRLRRELEQAGHVFTSSTDTEVIVHLIESLGDLRLEDAAARAVARLQGAFAFALVSAREPDVIVAAEGAIDTQNGNTYGIRIDLAGFPYTLPKPLPKDWPPHPDVPHRYNDGSLCIMRSTQWRTTFTVAFVVAKTAIWLAKYELWKRNGHVWPGKHQRH